MCISCRAAAAKRRQSYGAQAAERKAMKFSVVLENCKEKKKQACCGRRRVEKAMRMPRAGRRRRDRKGSTGERGAVHCPGS